MNDEDRELWRTLKNDRSWPALLNQLAERAAEARHSIVVDRAQARTFKRMQNRSLSSSTVLPADVPVGQYSALPNWDATFYTYLGEELTALPCNDREVPLQC